ncbi:MAG: heavy-metal-associated domain-containing protein [Anaeroplasma sp.]
MYKVLLSIEGMMCGMCEAHICDAVRKSSNAKKIKANHKKNEVTFLLDDENKIIDIIENIQKLGYKVLDKKIETK